MPVKSIVFAEGSDRDTGHDRATDDIRRKAQELGISIECASRHALDEMVAGLAGRAHQGVVAKATPYKYASMAEVVAAADGASALVVVCDHITDAGNLGAIVRSAESAGACGVVVPNRRAAQITPATYKTSAGAVSHMKIAQVPNLCRAIDELKEAGFWAVGATEHADDLLWQTDMQGRIALVMGNEHDGISQLVMKNCDMLCKLPQRGSISSLNVAQASTVFMYEWLRQNLQGS